MPPVRLNWGPLHLEVDVARQEWARGLAEFEGVAVVRQKAERVFEQPLHVVLLPQRRGTDRYHEVEVATPVLTEVRKLRSAPAQPLIRAIGVGSDLQEVQQQIRHIREHAARDAVDAKIDVLALAMDVHRDRVRRRGRSNAAFNSELPHDAPFRWASSIRSFSTGWLAKRRMSSRVNVFPSRY